MELELANDLVVVFDKHEVDFHALAGTRVAEDVGDAIAVGHVSDLRLGLGKVVLVMRVLDMRQEVPASADEVQASAKQIPGRAHFGRVHVGLRGVPPRSSMAILKASILSFLALPPWMAFM